MSLKSRSSMNKSTGSNKTIKGRLKMVNHAQNILSLPINQSTYVKQQKMKNRK